MTATRTATSRGEHDPEQPDVAVRKDAIDHDLRQDRQEELQPGRDESQRPGDRERPPMGPEERPEPGEAVPGLGDVLEPLGVGDERRVPAPALEELRARDALEPVFRVRVADTVAPDLVQDDPVVALPVDDRRQRQLVQPALRRAHRPRGQPELGGARGDPGEARPVRRGVHDLADLRRRDLLAEVAADHPEARGAAVGLVELVEVREPPRRLRRARGRSGPGSVELGGVGRRAIRERLGLLVAHVLVRGGGRKDLLGEVERDPREVMEVVVGDAVLDPATELGEVR